MGSATAQSKKRDPLPHRSRLYHDLAPAYHAIWPAIVRKRIRAQVEALQVPVDRRVLEVGVGTGVSLDSYPDHAEVVGVDLSTDMLAEAERRIERHGWRHVTVAAMNAEQLTFADASFDFVTSFHTISVVNNPHAMLREMVRVARPGGTILLINHFRSRNPLIANVVDSAGSLTKRIGWRTDLAIDRLVADLPLRVEEQKKTSPLSLFTVLKAIAKPT